MSEDKMAVQTIWRCLKHSNLCCFSLTTNINKFVNETYTLVQKYLRMSSNDLELLIELLNVLQIAFIPVEYFYEFFRDDHTHSCPLL